MSRSAGRRGWIALALLACLGSLAACKPASPDDDAVQAPSATSGSEPDAGYDLIASIDGIWATTRRAGSPETVYMLAHVVDHEMEISRNGVGLDLGSEDVDPDQGIATFSFRKSPTRERVTFARIPHGGETGGFTLRVTYADGSFEDLSYVRRMGKRDMEELEAAVYERPLLQSATGILATTSPALVDCETPGDFRARTVCRDQALRSLDQNLAGRLAERRATGADVEGSRVAALKQLDACSHSQCLRQAYTDWLRYLDENFSVAAKPVAATPD